MKPIDFRQSTKVLQKPATMTDKECASLHVWSDGRQCVSCWKPTLGERLHIAFGGKVWLGVASGGTQPPVFISGKSVFYRKPILARALDSALSLVEWVKCSMRAFRSASAHPYDERSISGRIASSFFGAFIGYIAGSIIWALIVDLWMRLAR